MFGMVVALAGIWLGFNILSGGDFLTARNLWNLSVQSVSIAIMATGMVLIIVSRNIDLSVGSQLGFLGYTMAMVQTEWIPNSLGLGFDRWYTWIVALAIGIALGAGIGAVQGFIVAYVGVPSFIVTLGGILIWRGLIFRYAQGQTLAPMDGNFQLLGGGPRGSLGEWRSWLLGAIGCGAHRLRHRRRPPAPAPLPVRRPPARRRHRARGDRLSDRPRRGLARQQLSVAGPARQPVRRATRHRRAARAG